MKKISVLFLLIIWFAFTATITAQNTVLSPAFPQVIPQSPEVNRLIGMINYPVSYNTGLVKTEIPIYEIKLNSGYTLPVKLVYQSSGFKPNERSFVGAGWSLVAEPQIAHAVNGLPDETPYKGLYMNKGVNLNGEFVQDTLVDAMYGRYDLEPDQYFYLLPHKGGSFFLNRPANNNSKKEFVTVPYDPIRIGNSPDLKSFNITDTDGVRYDFIPIEYTETQTENQQTEAISVYKAERILTPNKESITFSYEGLTASSPYKYTLRNYEQSATLDIKRQSSNGDATIAYCNGKENVLTDEFINYPYEKSNGRKVKLIQRDVTGTSTVGTEMRISTYNVFHSDGIKDNDLVLMCNDTRTTNYWIQSISSKYLSRINFPGGSIEFTYAMITEYQTSQKVLNGIVIKDYLGNVVKRFQLLTERFGERPCLNGVLETSKDGLSQRQYSFQYWDRRGVAYDTPHVNPWGYYQLSGNNQTNIPELYTEFALYNDNGIPVDTMYFRYGGKDFYQNGDEAPGLTFMLKSVTYPTGGRTEFQYERNRFEEPHRTKSVSNGSLRIKEIKNLQSDGTVASRRIFKYGRGEYGQGLPVRVLTFYDFMTSYEQVCYKQFAGMGPPSWLETYRVYKVDLHARPVVNDYLESSASIVYDYVAEYADEEGKCGKTVYEYDYSSLNAIRSVREAVPPYCPLLHKRANRPYKDWSVGQLLRKAVYDGKGNLLSEQKNTYRKIENLKQITYMKLEPQKSYLFYDPAVTSWETIRTLKIGRVVPNPVDSRAIAKGVPEPYRYDGSLSFFTGYKLLTSSEVKEYEGGRTFGRKTEYEYNDYLLPTMVKNTLNGGKTQVESVFYPTDFADEVSKTMVNRNIVRPVIHRVTTMGNAKYDVYNPYRLSSDIPVVDRIETGKGDKERETRIQFIRYDDYGNLLEAVKDGSQRISYIYGYGSLYPVAKLEGAGYESFPERFGQIKSYSDSTMLAGTCASLRSTLRGIGLVTSYTYRPLEGVSSVVAPNGNRKSFHYNKFGELAAELDYGNNKEKEYGYHYKCDSVSAPVEPPPSYQPLELRIGAGQTYPLGRVSIAAWGSGGSGDYSYSWVLTNDKGLNYRTENSNFTYEFTVLGTYQLTCTIHDRVAGASATSVVSFEIVPNMAVSFQNIHTFKEGNERFIEAYIDCPCETDITFLLEYQTNTYKGITFYINDYNNNNKFVRYGNGADFVTVRFPKGQSRIYIVYNQGDKCCRTVINKATNGVTYQYPYVLDAPLD
ncbi:hypothetical protein AALN73_06820 [Bacteroides stercorirosoris]|uniref:hypothetical protein n=1 Tax=Bacteroides stercorirosoris TaxID=871324 RepID=UPI0023F8D599|nr:hypothetical protein [Bacteroides stercorirosoris]